MISVATSRKKSADNSEKLDLSDIIFRKKGATSEDDFMKRAQEMAMQPSGRSNQLDLGVNRNLSSSNKPSHLNDYVKESNEFVNAMADLSRGKITPKTRELFGKKPNKAKKAKGNKTVAKKAEVNLKGISTLTEPSTPKKNLEFKREDLLKAFIMKEVMQRYDLNRIYERIPSAKFDE